MARGNDGAWKSTMPRCLWTTTHSGYNHLQASLKRLKGCWIWFSLTAWYIIIKNKSQCGNVPMQSSWCLCLQRIRSEHGVRYVQMKREPNCLQASWACAAANHVTIASAVVLHTDETLIFRWLPSKKRKENAGLISHFILVYIIVCPFWWENQ